MALVRSIIFFNREYDSLASDAEHHEEPGLDYDEGSLTTSNTNRHDSYVETTTGARFRRGAEHDAPGIKPLQSLQPSRLVLYTRICDTISVQPTHNTWLLDYMYLITRCEQKSWVPSYHKLICTLLLNTLLLQISISFFILFYPLNDTTQSVDSEEEGRSSTMDRQWLIENP